MANEYIFGPTALTGTLYADVSPVGGTEFQVALTGPINGYYYGNQPGGKAPGIYDWVARQQAGGSQSPGTDLATSYPGSLVWNGAEESVTVLSALTAPAGSTGQPDLYCRQYDDVTITMTAVDDGNTPVPLLGSTLRFLVSDSPYCAPLIDVPVTLAEQAAADSSDQAKAGVMTAAIPGVLNVTSGDLLGWAEGTAADGTHWSFPNDGFVVIRVTPGYLPT